MLSFTALLGSALAAPLVPITSVGSSEIKPYNNNNNNNNNNNSTNVHKRHSKRDSNWYDYNENSTFLEWQNPCGGEYEDVTPRPKPKNPKQFYNILKVSALHACRSLNTSRQHIKAEDIHMWALHNYTYKFLPKLKAKSRIALKRWHRNMQTYVGSFAYLHREQRKWDYRKSQHESVIAQELKELLFSSRRMLCDLETAVNDTQPRHNPLYQISRTEMNRRLKLRTKRHVEQHPGVVQEADTIDIIYVKYYYLDFLQKMRQILLENKKRPGQRKNRKEYNEIQKRNSAGSRSRGSAKNSRNGNNSSSSSSSGSASSSNNDVVLVTTTPATFVAHTFRAPNRRKQNQRRNQVALKNRHRTAQQRQRV